MRLPCGERKCALKPSGILGAGLWVAVQGLSVAACAAVPAAIPARGRAYPEFRRPQRSRRDGAGDWVCRTRCPPIICARPWPAATATAPTTAMATRSCCHGAAGAARRRGRRAAPRWPLVAAASGADRRSVTLVAGARSPLDILHRAPIDERSNGCSCDRTTPGHSSARPPRVR